MQGLQDSRSKVGELARGKNMYPGGNAAQSGPGGPDMGRPPNPVAAVPQQAADAVRQNMMKNDQMQSTQVKQQGLQRAAQNPMAAQMNPNLQQLQNRIAPQKPQAMAAKSKKLGDIAKQALQAAAQRKMQRSR